MKNILFSILLLSYCLVGCKKDSNSDAITGKSRLKNLSQATKDMLALNSYAAMKQAYSLLTAEERQQLWMAKYDLILDDNRNDLNEEQVTLINTFKNVLTKHGMVKLEENPKIGESVVALNRYILDRNFSKYQQVLLIEHPYVTDDFRIGNSEAYVSMLVANSTKSLIGQTSSLFGQPDCTC